MSETCGCHGSWQEHCDELEDAVRGRDRTIENLRTCLETKDRELQRARDRISFLEAQAEDPGPAALAKSAPGEGG
jgi:hypothetical protein